MVGYSKKGGNSIANVSCKQVRFSVEKWQKKIQENLPTNSEGTTNEFQLLAWAKATEVAGPPIAAEEATSNNRGSNERYFPQTLFNAHNISPWIL